MAGETAVAKFQRLRDELNDMIDACEELGQAEDKEPLKLSFVHPFDSIKKKINKKEEKKKKKGAIKATGIQLQINQGQGGSGSISQAIPPQSLPNPFLPSPPPSPNAFEVLAWDCSIFLGTSGFGFSPSLFVTRKESKKRIRLKAFSNQIQQCSWNFSIPCLEIMQLNITHFRST